MLAFEGPVEGCRTPRARIKVCVYLPSSHPTNLTMNLRTYSRVAKDNQDSVWKAMMTATMAGRRSSIASGRRSDRWCSTVFERQETTGFRAPPQTPGVCPSKNICANSPSLSDGTYRHPCSGGMVFHP